MECSLGNAIMKTNEQTSLNPYSNGMLTWKMLNKLKH